MQPVETLYVLHKGVALAAASHRVAMQINEL